jgi:MFS superfamily sulfate permease-like transporter
VLRGFITAVGVSIIIEQVDTLLGISLPDVHGWYKIPKIIAHFTEIHIISTIMAVASIAFIFSCDYLKNKFKDRPRLKWLPFIPEMLIAVIIGIGVTAIWELDKMGLQVLGRYDTSFPGIPSLCI